jgi:hypothetical protein
VKSLLYSLRKGSDTSCVAEGRPNETYPLFSSHTFYYIYISLRNREEVSFIGNKRIPESVFSDYEYYGGSTRLPRYKGLIVDPRLREFRRFNFQEPIPFDSAEGEKLLTELLEIIPQGRLRDEIIEFWELRLPRIVGFSAKKL